jgi:hypothetical protein
LLPQSVVLFSLQQPRNEETMSLGPNNTICTEELIRAMRARLERDEPGLGAAVDKPGAQKNLAAYGEAIYQIAHRATVEADRASDAAFWAWVNALTEYVTGLNKWQQQVSEAFRAWAPTDRSSQQLRAQLLALEPPADLPNPPRRLQGRIV